MSKSKRPNKPPKSRDTLVSRRRGSEAQPQLSVEPDAKVKVYDRLHIAYSNQADEHTRKLSPRARKALGLDPFAMQRMTIQRDRRIEESVRDAELRDQADLVLGEAPLDV